MITLLLGGMLLFIDRTFSAYASVVVYLLRCALARDGWTRRGKRRASDDAVDEKSLENSMQCNLILCSCKGI